MELYLSPARAGSGKTSTLYTALSAINDAIRKIITIEDPIEYQLRGINQIEVSEKSGLTFARGLRSILYLKHNLSWLVWRAGEHLMSNTYLLQRKYGIQPGGYVGCPVILQWSSSVR